MRGSSAANSAMAEDLRLYSDFLQHAKTQMLRERLGADGILALLGLWCAAANNWRDGNLAGKSDEFLEKAAGWTGKAGELASVLRKVGFLDGDEFNSSLHNWVMRQPWVAAHAERSEQSREAAYAKWSRLEPADRSAAASKASRARWDRVRVERLEMARKKGTHTEQEWETLLAVCANRCLDCGAEDALLVKDHIIPIFYTERPDATDGIENLQPLCDCCNKAKGSDTRDLRPTDWRDACRMHAARTQMRTPNPTTLLEEKTSNPLACTTEMRASRTHAPTNDEMMLFRVQQQLRDEGKITGMLAEWAKDHNITHRYVDGRPVAIADAVVTAGEAPPVNRKQVQGAGVA